MPRDGSGNYTAPANSVNPAVAETTIDASDFNDLVDDLETALTNSIARDGQTTTTAAIAFANGIETDTIAEDSANSGVTVDSVLLKDGGATLTADLILGANIVLEGSTADGFETTLAVTDPTADRTITFPDATGTVPLLESANTFTENQTVESDDAGAGAGPRVIAYRNSASPAASDLIGAYDFDGEDDGGNQTTYARLQGKIDDPADASEDGSLHYYKMVAGTLTDQGEVRAGSIATSELPAGSIIQVVNTETGAAATGTTMIPNDDTIPQNTEGDEYMTLVITPTDANSVLIIEAMGVFANSNQGIFTMALFQDSTADALAAVQDRAPASNQQSIYTLRHKMTAGTTSATTFKIRAGNQAYGTTTFNGAGGSRTMGGVMASSITITEVAA